MHPVRTSASNFVWRGPSPDVGDAWAERRREQRVTFLTWQLTDDERAALAAGGTLRLGIYSDPIPPVSLEVSQQQPLSAAGAALRNRALVALAEQRREDSPERPGWWVVSPDVQRALEDEAALDPDDGSVPTLLGRPLMVFSGKRRGLLEFNPGPEQTNEVQA